SFVFMFSALSDTYILSLHDALPILRKHVVRLDGSSGAFHSLFGSGEHKYRLVIFLPDPSCNDTRNTLVAVRQIDNQHTVIFQRRSEEHTSELQSRFDSVCRLLLETT